MSDCICAVLISLRQRVCEKRVALLNRLLDERPPAVRGVCSRSVALERHSLDRLGISCSRFLHRISFDNNAKRGILGN
ncbi:hypothetical protein D3C81_2083490 [compost metagenome]